MYATGYRCIFGTVVARFFEARFPLFCRFFACGALPRVLGVFQMTSGQCPCNCGWVEVRILNKLWGVRLHKYFFFLSFLGAVPFFFSYMRFFSTPWRLRFFVTFCPCLTRSVFCQYHNVRTFRGCAFFFVNRLTSPVWSFCGRSSPFVVVGCTLLAHPPSFTGLKFLCRPFFFIDESSAFRPLIVSLCPPFLDRPRLIS